MIGLLGEGNVFYVSPAHSEILILLMENTYLGRMCFKQIFKVGKSRGEILGLLNTQIKIYVT